MDLLPGNSTSVVVASLDEVDDIARDYLRADKALNTRRGYLSDCRIFADWCRGYGLSALPASPETVVRFLSAQAHAGVSVKTLGRRRAAIRWAHEEAGHASPTLTSLVKRAMEGIARTEHMAVRRYRAPILDSQLLAMLSHIDAGSLAGVRDRALLTLGFGGAFRRSELVGIEVEHLDWRERDLVVLLPSSKTDQEGRGQTVPVLNGRRLRPVEALRAWLDAAGIVEGPVFRGLTKHGTVRKGALSVQAVVDIVKHYAECAGFNPAHFAAHSLRSGFVTTGVLKNGNLLKIMDVTRHRKMDTLRAYTIIAEQFRDHVGESFM